MHLEEIRKKYLDQLSAIYPQNEINSIFNIVTGHILNYAKKDIFLQKDKEQDKNTISKFNYALEELKKNKPVQYITGETEFYGLKFIVNEKVLIPRPETEELVDWIIKEIKFLPEPLTGKIRILDIGTGSGCIAISLKKNIPDAEVYGVDISEDALIIAKKNSLINNVNVNFLKADIVKPGRINEMDDFSIIVSNPPYVNPGEKEKMPKNVVGFEPHIALFVPEGDPLFYYEAIAKYAKFHLISNGYLCFEINENYGGRIKQLLELNNFTDVVLKKDLSGKDRMIRAKKKQR